MPEVRISIPTLLHDCTGGARSVALEASSAQAALDALFERYPLLKVHLLEGGKLRPHLVILCDGRPLKPFDEDTVFDRPQDLHILQAVSGG